MITYESKKRGGPSTTHMFEDYQTIAKSNPKDRSKPLPYFRYGEYRKQPWINCKAKSDLDLPMDLSNPLVAEAYAKAYDKFVNQAKQGLSIQMGANLAESRKTLEMIAIRGGQLLNLARNLRRGKIPLNKRRLKRDWSGRGKVQKPGGWWLEAHFAWEPLIKDIYTGCQMLSEPVWDLTPITARGSATERRDRSHPRDWRFAEVDVSAIKQHCRISGNCRVTNPNAYLLNRVGLINPVSVAWEVVPFSFAIDWFLPVSSFLGSYTDQVGWALERGYITLKRDVDSTWVIDNPYDTPENNLRLSTAYAVKRSVMDGSLPIPGLFDRRGNGIRSLTRGTTAIALLVGFLRKNP